MAWIQRSLVGCPIDKRGRVVKDFGVQQGSILWHSGLLFLQAETAPHQNMEGQAVSTRISLAPVARAITAAMLCVMVENAGAQQFGDAEGGRQLARENCAECYAIDNGTGASANPNAPTFKDLATPPA